MFKRTMLLLLPLFFEIHSLQAQPDPFTGQWEGNFMEDFRTLLEISSPSPGVYSGTVRMFSGPQMIQNDLLDEIRVSGLELTFLIPAKETSFIGRINEDSTTLSGQFLFPDGSEHPLMLSRKMTGMESGKATVTDPVKEFRALTERALTPDEMKEDLQYLVTSLQQYHPRLYSYTPEMAMDRLVDSIMESLNDPLTIEDYFRRIAPVTDAVQCSHTGVRLPADYRRMIGQHGKFLPLWVLCRPEEIMLIGSSGSSAPIVPPGTRILSINGIPSGKVLDELFCLVPSEGNNQTTKWLHLSKRFAWYYHTLDPSEEFMVEYDLTGANGKVAYGACGLEMVEPVPPVPVEPVPLSFRITSSGKTGIIEMPSFAVMDMEGYMAELEHIFIQLSTKKVPHLILDLRGNEGGHPIFAAQLLSYLVDEEFTYFRQNADATEFEPLYHPMSPDPHAFNGDLIVLVDGGCLSTTGHLISLIGFHTQALFAGEEPGSTFRCNDHSIQLKLPNSGIEANIPRTTFETAVYLPGDEREFNVDLPVSPDPEDLASGTDRALLTCLELIGDAEGFSQCDICTDRTGGFVYLQGRFP